MSAPLDCPPLECWPAVFGNTIPEDLRERYERHLESCLACQQRLDQAEECQDALLSLGRRVGDPTVAPADPTLSEFLERLREVKSTDPHVPPEPTDLYFLRPTDRSDLLGTLGAYEVLEVIGQGGMGVVLKAYEPALHRMVAIKVMVAAVAGSATARRRFTREAHAAAAVCHDHVVPVHGVHEADCLPYLVMQYVAGESLQARLDRGGPLAVADIVRIGLQTAAGLAAAHVQGLIHRDVKPANLLLEEKDEGGRMKDESRQDTASDSSFILHPSSFKRVKITDFGLARMIDEVQLTQAGVVAGTPQYMAPEQARGETVDHRADLFSLGSVLYACCTGVPPFRGESALAVLRQVNEDAPRPIRSLNPTVPAWLEALVARLMAKDPADRFQSAAEVATLLEGFLAHLRQPATAPVPEPRPLPPEDVLEESVPERQRKGVRRSLRFCLLGLLLLLALELSIGLLAQAILPPEQPPATEVYQDFRGSRRPLLPFELMGPAADLVSRPEEEGWRITLSADRPNTDVVGLALNTPLKGNFEITAGYEILQVDRPTSKFGAGFHIHIETRTPTKETAEFLRLMGRNQRELYTCSRRTILDGKTQWTHQHISTTSKSGELRLTRTGTELTFWASEGAAHSFQELCRRDLGSEDVNVAWVAAYTGRAPSGVDIRIVDLKVRSNIPPFAAIRPEIRKVWFVLATLFVLLFLSPLGVWLYLRQRRLAGKIPARTPGKDQSANTEAASSSISLACSACGKKLKARADLAGKKVKCPQCGKAVVVPASPINPGTDPLSATSCLQPAGAGRFPRRLWQTALALLAALGLGLGLIVWGLAPGEQGPAAEPSAPARNRLAFDFRKKLDDLPALALFGPEAEEVVKTDAQGLRITLPAGRTDCRTVGANLPIRIRGDFDIDLGYELLSIGDNIPDPAAGVQMRLTFDAPSAPLAALARFRNRYAGQPANLFQEVGHDGETFAAYRITILPDGKEKPEGVDVRAREPRGRLKLARLGTSLKYLVSDGGSPYQLIRSEEVGARDVESLGFLGFSGWGPVAVDVRFTDLAIDADEYPDGVPGRVVWAQGWLAAGLLLGLVLTTCLALGVWSFMQARGRGRQMSPGTPAQPKRAEPIAAAAKKFGEK